MKTNTKLKTVITRHINTDVVRLAKRVANIDQLMNIFTFEEALQIMNAFYDIDVELQKVIEKLEKEEKQEKINGDKDE